MARTVLIIEDDPDIADVLRYSLENKKFETRLAVSGEEGLSASLDKDNPPAVILLDLLLPGMNGLEICRRLRKEALTRHTPIVMVTARASRLDYDVALAAGVDAYITKPFSVRKVVEYVGELLSGEPNDEEAIPN